MLEKNASRPSRDRDFRDRDYNPVAQLYGLETHHLCDEQGTFTRCVDFYRLDVWPACDVSQRRTVLLPAASTPLSPSVVRHRIESITTLIRAFVSSRVDYCCSLLIGSPRSVSSHRQASARPHSSLLSAAARVVINTKKYESGLSRILQASLAGCYWTGFSSKCLQQYISMAVAYAAYLTELCVYDCYCVSKSSWRYSVRHNQQLGLTTLQTLWLWFMNYFYCYSLLTIQWISTYYAV